MQVAFLPPEGAMGLRIEASVVTDEPGGVADEMYGWLTTLARRADARLTEPVVRLDRGKRWAGKCCVVVTAGVIE